MSKEYGLIGYPLGHSFSSDYFTAKFKRENISDASYKLFALNDIKDFNKLLETHPNLSGLNVTVPYKETVIPNLDYLDVKAEAIGAVNCIAIDNGKLRGYNTDYQAFRQTLQDNGIGKKYKALVLGTGGAAKAVKKALDDEDIEALFVSRARKVHLSYKELTTETIRDHRLIINTTPIGMFPETETYPDIPYNALTSGHILYDLIYNPAQTTFLARGKEQGSRTINGMEMFRLQAELSWSIWNRTY